MKNFIKKRSQTKFGRIVVLTGARQVGKTTFAKRLFSDFTYISIEDPLLRLDFKQLSASQWERQYPKAILDEIQKEPSLIESIKSVYDQFETPRYVLLGSSQLLLLQKVKETLAGRCLIYEIYPLTLPEIRTKDWDEEVELSTFQTFCSNFNFQAGLPSFRLDSKFADKTAAWNHYTEFGGYPAIVDDSVPSDLKREWLDNYIRTYLERDVRDLADFRNLDPFIKIQKMSALLTGQQMNNSQLAKEAGISTKTAQKFLSYLEISYQSFSVKPWFRNNLKRLNKSSKLHYLDPGIIRSILKKEGELTGNEFESAVVAEIYKQIKNAQIPCDLYHLRTFDGKEVDLLLEFETGYVAFEIKSSSKVVNSDARNLRNLDKLLDKPLLKSFVLSNDLDIKQLDELVWAVPVAYFLG